MTKRPETVVIRNLQPSLDNGRFALKRPVGGEIAVQADIFKDGHDVVAAMLKWRPVGGDDWREAPMKPLVNDRWTATLCVTSPGAWEFTVEAWGDPFLSWQEEIAKKFAAGQRALDSEILEGARLIEGAALRAGRCADGDSLNGFAGSMRAADAAGANALAHSPELGALMAFHADRSLSTTFEPAVPVRVDREAATFAAWYEFFPRSAEGKPDAGSTFRGCLGRIDDAASMGFDVVYFPPIHPIGETKRKGPNNSLECSPGDPGVPYAIGNKKQGVNGGGHKDVAPELGTLEDFDELVREIRARGMEVALDFAINCSPDHPYVEKHPEWFFKRPDGSIKYAENPPKKYEDVYPLNFHNENWRALWDEMLDVVLFWCRRGVGIFRVDNPHTKPVSFWEWLIAEVVREFPGTVFLSEAFTRPKMMHELAKAGFTQSYTYFTWRNTKWELDEYLRELSTPPVVDFFRPNFFTNTPDILPYYLQQNGRQGFLIRSVLAAMASPVYGIYSGFELCENAAVPGKEEYLDSEKYQFKGRDWNAPGNIKEYIGKLNWIRRTNRALRHLDNLRVLEVGGEIVAFLKATPALDNIIVVAVTVDAWNRQSGVMTLPLGDLGLAENEPYGMEDLITGERFVWTGAGNLLILDPHERPAHVFRLRRRIGREGGIDLFGWEAPGQ
jgi:starch synthase (maltosyl-transferring)